MVTKDANIKLAARRIIYGKGVNAGQTCVAPDYVLVDARVRGALLEQLKEQILLQYGTEPQNSNEYGRIVSDLHFDRLLELKKNCEVIAGGHHDRSSRFIELTLLNQPHPTSKICSEEIFGPLLPIFPYQDMDEAFQVIRDKPKPLAAYIFSDNRKETADFISNVSFGGGCVNDTIVHPSNTNLKFGGVAASGIGSYQAYQSFKTFTHAKPMVHSSTSIDIPIRYLPASDWKTRVLRLVK